MILLLTIATYYAVKYLSSGYIALIWVANLTFSLARSHWMWVDMGMSLYIVYFIVQKVNKKCFYFSHHLRILFSMVPALECQKVITKLDHLILPIIYTIKMK